MIEWVFQQYVHQDVAMRPGERVYTNLRSARTYTIHFTKTYGSLDSYVHSYVQRSIGLTGTEQDYRLLTSESCFKLR